MFVSLFNKLLTSESRDDERCLYESTNLKFMPVLSKLWIVKVERVSRLADNRLILDVEHFFARWVIINLKSNFAPLGKNSYLFFVFVLHFLCLNPSRYPVFFHNNIDFCVDYLFLLFYYKLSREDW